MPRGSFGGGSPGVGEKLERGGDVVADRELADGVDLALRAGEARRDGLALLISEGDAGDPLGIGDHLGRDGHALGLLQRDGRHCALESGAANAERGDRGHDLAARWARWVGGHEGLPGGMMGGDCTRSEVPSEAT